MRYAYVVPAVGMMVLLLAVLGASAMKNRTEPSPAARSEGAAESFAIVELFTSEGCSSCPPADELLSKIIKESRGKRVFAMSFHVDYWDRLGWPDPFGQAAFTARQNDYANAFDARSVYTPQMIVNGRVEFVGSNDDKAENAINRALKEPAVASVTLKTTMASEGRRAAVEYVVKSAPSGAALNVALVQRGLVTKVERGENAGETLRHDNVVRVFKTIPLDDKGEGRVDIELPNGANASDLSVIAFVQERDLRAIVGAASVELAKPPN